MRLNITNKPSASAQTWATIFEKTPSVGVPRANFISINRIIEQSLKMYEYPHLPYLWMIHTSAFKHIANIVNHLNISIEVERYMTGER